ncbi:MAG: family 16 glycosylhydrolase, partial [Candidatus Cloacimonadaceae bacterium]|nr:family 16 glycosylhydrolase [Candidatus Cloacimonadaceae bacterium]
AVLLLLLFTGCDKISAPTPLVDPDGLANYTLVWSDEFDQESQTPDTNNWGYDLGYGEYGWGNDEWQQYTNAPENVRVENGNLVITAIWDSLNYPVPGKRDGSVTSARINSKNKFSFKFGKIQARIKVPTDDGMWPAFWMLGKNHDSLGWPQCGEIDIMEVSPLLHGNATTMSTVHWWDDASQSHVYEGKTKKMKAPLSNDYHVYEVEWDEKRIVGKIDNISYFVKIIDPSTMDEFLKEFFLIFNVAVGGSLGGTPTADTNWPQSMYVDWVRVYQREETLIPIETFGIFTDETPVDAALQIGLNAEVYVWENTLSAGSIPPFEGANVLSWATTGQGWFGAGISSNTPLDLSTFEQGSIKFMIKIPPNITFKIGINDAAGRESYVTFPANQSAYGLIRNGDWGQATIPVSAIKGNVDLEILSYEFIILEEQGIQCQFAIDDIYWDGGGAISSNVSFNANTYTTSDTGAIIALLDTGVPNTQQSVSVSNGTDTINIGINLNYLGAGSKPINFGPTNETTSTIAISAGSTLSLSYTDSAGNIKTASATITGSGSSNTMGIFSETHTNPMLPYSQIINSADWSGNPAEPNEQSTAVSPVDGSYVLSVTYADIGMGWGGIAINFGAQDISEYTTFVMHINKTAMPSLARFGVKFEDNSGGATEVNLASYTPVLNGNWARYEIPMSHFSAVNLSNLKFLGLWNPQNSGNAYLTGTLYFDNIYLIK